MQEKKLRDLLDWTDRTKEFLSELLEKVDGYDSIVIFGAGIGGKQTYELLREHHMDEKIKAFSDNNKSKIGTIYCDKPVIASTNIAFYGDNLIVLVSSTAYDIIKRQLMNLGLCEENIFFFQPAGVSLNENEDRSFIKNNISKFEVVYDMLMDEESKWIYCSLLNYRMTKSIKYLEDLRPVVLPESEQYFDKRILDSYYFDKTFVDCGAYNGDTLSAFYKQFPEWKGKYYCLEANEVLCASLRKEIEDKTNIILLNYAIWGVRGRLCFDVSGDVGGRISSKGVEVDCDSLDNLLKGEEIDFIKMDIEGAEEMALLGGKDILKNSKPILAICIYHKPEDFFNIPLMIEEMVPNEYCYYVRQYRYGQSETVLYALPKSRKKS